MKPPQPSFDILEQYLNDRSTSWSIGTFGAMAEFFHASTEPLRISKINTALTAKTSLGSIQFTYTKSMQLIPYEGLSKLEGAWTQGVLVCIPITEAQMANRSVISEIKTKNKRSFIFDLGLCIRHLDICIKTDSKELIALFRANLGKSIFNPDLNLIEAIKNASPIRIFKSKSACIKVYSHIPTTDGSHPLGPHTHFSTKLLKHNQTQAATIPVPADYVPVLAFYPPNPIRDEIGSIRPFDIKGFEHFQDLLSTFQPKPLARVKHMFRQAMNKGVGPDECTLPSTKAERTTLRVAIRQHYHSHGPSVLLSKWKANYEPTGRQ
jgi:hypothetical protein